MCVEIVFCKFSKKGKLVVGDILIARLVYLTLATFIYSEKREKSRETSPLLALFNQLEEMSKVFEKKEKERQGED